MQAACIRYSEEAAVLEAEKRIDALPEIIAALPGRERALVERIFQVVATEGEVVPPVEMTPWLERTFGSVDVVRHQRVVRVTNRWTYEGAMFNALRSRRPSSGASQSAPIADAELHERIERARGDDFCDPEHHTPADTFGRVRGRHVITASNVAKADGWHGVGIFDRHDPLDIDAPLVEDILSVAGEWADRAHSADRQAIYLFLLWNCLWRAGASLVHGHVQMTLSREMAHARVELLRAAAERYRAETGGDYFADLVEAHRVLGLTVDDVRESDEDGAEATNVASGGKVERFASLTPVKEREVVLIAPTYHDGRLDPAELGGLAETLTSTILTALEEMGVRAFNVVAYGPPLATPQPADGSWSGFPLIARFVDRGNPLSPTVDVAALELFGSSVIACDPFEVARTLQRRT
ncbi:MAG: hypothetical protein ACXVDA_19110 [Ktedonobacterales bacterium]